MMNTVFFDDQVTLHNGDFTQAMQASIDILQDTGGTIFLSSEGNGVHGGVYTTTTFQDLVRANGTEPIIITTADDQMAAIEHGDGGTSRLGVNASVGLHFENLRVMGGVAVSNSSEISLEAIHSIGSGGAGISFTNVSGLTVTDILSESANVHGMRLSNVEDAIFTGTTIVDPNAYGIGIQNGRQLSQNVYFYDTSISGSGGDGVDIKGQRLYTGDPLIYFNGIDIDITSPTSGVPSGLDLRGHVSVIDANITVRGAVGVKMRGEASGIDDFSPGNGTAGYGTLENVVVTSIDGSGTGFRIESGAVDIVNTHAIGFAPNASYSVGGGSNKDFSITFQDAKIDGIEVNTYDDYLALGGTENSAYTLLFSEDPKNGFVDGTNVDDVFKVGSSDFQGDTVGAGDDVIFAGLGHDFVDSGSGQDTIFGSLGNDNIYGGSGEDELFGGSGHDKLFGGAGNDFIDLGADTNSAGAQFARGGAGDDIYFIARDNGFSAVYDEVAGGGNDRVIFSDVSFDETSFQQHYHPGFSNSIIIKAAGGMDIHMNNVLGSYNAIESFEFSDGTVINDFHFGGAGDDHIRGGGGNDFIDLGADMNGGSAQFARGGAGDDIYFIARDNGFSAVYDEVAGGGNDRVIFSDVSFDETSFQHHPDANYSDSIIIQADGGMDIHINNVLGAENAIESFEFNDGTVINDFSFGGTGDDHIRGGDGADFIDGGTGWDRLTGGNGADTFVFSDGYGNDKITDFDVNSGDVLRLDVAGFDTFTAVRSAAQQNNSDVVINFSDADTVTLQGIQLAALTQDDFAFV
jgi:Ca2+-binding RTX toxin-like protein